MNNAKNFEGGQKTEHRSENDLTQVRFNDSQRLMLNQFTEYHLSLIRNVFNCPAGSEFLAIALLTHTFVPQTKELLIEKTGCTPDELEKSLSCLESKGAISCRDDQVRFTEKGNELMMDITNKALSMFVKFSERFTLEKYYPG